MVFVGAIVWLIAASVLALGEFLVMDFSLLMLAGGALVTAGVAVFSIPLWLEVATFAIASILGILILRPMLRRQFRKSIQSSAQFDSRQLEGRQAIVISPVSDDSSEGGLVRISGELWSAQTSEPGMVLDEGDTAYVLEIRGTTAVVWKGV